MNDISLVGNAIQITRDNNSTKGYVNVPTEYDAYEEHDNTYVSLLIGKDNFTWKITELTIGGDSIDDLSDALTKLSAVFPNANSGNGGSGMVLESYQNSAMSTAVMAYVYRDESNNIYGVYEPIRNNKVYRKQFAYADSIDKFPFDNVDWVDNSLNDVKLVDIGSDAIITASTISTAVIKSVAGKTGLEIANHIQTGNFGLYTPNGAEIYIVGDAVELNGCIMENGRDSNCAGVMDSIGDNSEIYNCKIGNGSEIDFNGCTGIIMRYIDMLNSNYLAINSNNSEIEILDFDNSAVAIVSATIFQNIKLGLRARVTAVKSVVGSVFGLFSQVDTTNGSLISCTIGDNLTYAPSADKSGIEIKKISGTVYEVSVTEIGGILYETLLAQIQTTAPSTITPTVISDTEIDLVWDAAADATNYILQRGLMADYSDASQIYSGTDLLFNDTGLTAATQYYYRVKAQRISYLDSTWTVANTTTNA